MAASRQAAIDDSPLKDSSRRLPPPVKPKPRPKPSSSEPFPDNSCSIDAAELIYSVPKVQQSTDIYDVPRPALLLPPPPRPPHGQETIYDTPKSGNDESAHVGWQGNGSEMDAGQMSAEVETGSLKTNEDIYDTPRRSSFEGGTSQARIATEPEVTEAIYDQPKKHDVNLCESVDIYDVPKPVVVNGSVTSQLAAAEAAPPPPSDVKSERLAKGGETAVSVFADNSMSLSLEIPSTSIPPVPPRSRNMSLSSIGSPIVYEEATLSSHNQKMKPRSITFGSIPVSDRERVSLSPSSPRDHSQYVWYWGKATREEVKHKLLHWSDGAFMVRDSSSFGEFTLTVRKGGDNKLIRILHYNGLYGFSDPLTFQSIAALIDFYQKESLKEYNPKLDICLTIPVPRYDDVDEDTVHDAVPAASPVAGQWKQRLKMVEEEFNATNEEFSALYDQHSFMDQKITTLQSQMQSQEMLIKMFEDQIELAERYDEHAKREEKRELGNNSRRLRDRIELGHMKMEEMVTGLVDQQASSKDIDCKMNALKPKIMHLQSKKAHYVDLMRQKSTEENLEPDKTYALFDPRNIRRSKRRAKDSSIYQNRDSLVLTAGSPPPIPQKSSGEMQPPLPPVRPHSRTFSEAVGPLNPSTKSSPIKTPHMRLLPKQISHPDGVGSHGSFLDHHPQLPRHMSLGSASYPQRAAALSAMPSIKSENWFMGNIDRKVAQDMLQQGYCNGTFLVRGKEGKWDQSQLKVHTHSVDIIYHSQIKHIQIFRYGDGRYGFSEEVTFDTLDELIQHHRQESLKKYNPDLDTPLLYPIGAHF